MPMHSRETSLASVAALCLLAGCGGADTDPLLLGSWRGENRSADGTLTGILALAYEADGTFREEFTGTYAASAPMYAGCRERGVATGTYRSNGLTLVQDFAVAGVGRSECTNASNNAAYAETNLRAGSYVGTYSYRIEGDRLTRTPVGSAGITFTRD